MKEGPGLIQSLAEVLDHDRNTAMDGWLFEMWFFASIRSGQVTFKTNGVQGSWEKANVVTFDPENVPNDLPNDGIWLKPLKWNQGGYDAVYVNKDQKVVRFVQVTRGLTHSLKLHYFYSLLFNFARYFETRKLEIYLLIPEQRVDAFKIGAVTGKGLLHEFGEGWGAREVINQIQIAGVIGFNL